MIHRTKKQSGFSLIELLIVVAIILVIAAIAIPNLLKAKAAGNSSSAVSGLRTVVSGEAVYRTSVTPNKYDTLAALAAAGQLDPAWQLAAVSATGHNGYSYSAPVAPGTDTFVFAALPVSYPNSGKNGFCATESGSIHVIDGTAGAPTAPADGAACVALPILGQ